MAEREIQTWVEKILQGEARAIAQAISFVENQEPGAQELLRRLFPHTGRSTIMGITGTAGSGKSTLVDCLVALLRKRGHTVGILAVDPTSPFTGGAILGDRIRMQAHATDPGTYIRSMATRGALGGLSRATLDAAMVLDAAGKEYILVETVGVGQDEVEVVKLADVTLLLLVPGMGDEVQTFKAGLMEIADVFIINKSDYAGAERLEQELQALVSQSVSREGWLPPIVKTVATRQEGVEQLFETILRYLEFSRRQGTFEQRQVSHWRVRLLDLLRERLLRQVVHDALENGALSQYAASIASRQADPYSVVDQILEQAGWRETKQ